jgi:serine O-acetyltransferase
MSGRAPARRTERRLQPRELAADNARLHPTLRAALREDARWYAVYRGERFEFGSPLGELANLVRLLFVADDFPPLVLYRLRTALAHARVPLAPWLLHRLCIALWDVRIGPHVVLGPGAYIPHGNVVIEGVTRIGPHAVLAPWVTVGCVQGDHVGPRIGENVFVSTHASVLGDIEVGSHSTIAASAVVTSDVPPHALAAGVPARVVDGGTRPTGVVPGDTP